MAPPSPGLQVGEIGVDETLVLAEVARQIHVAVELDDGDTSRAGSEQWAKHRSESQHSRELVRRTASGLDRENERDRLTFRCIVEADWLSDAIILDDEIFGLQAVEEPILIFDESWDQDKIRAGTERGFLRKRGRGACSGECDGEKKRRAAQTSLPCDFLRGLHPAHLPIDARASDNRLLHPHAFSSGGDTRRLC